MSATVRVFAVLSAVACATTLVSGRAGQQRPPFRAGVQVVTLDVLVREGNVPVGGLTPMDFDVTDNGVPQTVESVSIDTLPIDLSVVMDVSGSVQDMLAQLKKDANEARLMLRPDDQIRVVVFTDAVTQVSPFQPPSSELSLETLPAAGMTSIYDAVAAALMRTRTPDRHELCVLFTDGDDTSSTIGGATVLEIARRSDVILQAFIVTPVPGGLPNLSGAGARANATRGHWWRFRGEDLDVSRVWLDDAATITGGSLQTIVGEGHVPKGLSAAINELRTSYLLRYTATGVAQAGWHELKVKLKRPGRFTVRTRKGYFGGGTGQRGLAVAMERTDR